METNKKSCALDVNGRTEDRFPDDVVMDILLFFPASDLHTTLRLVSRQWRRIIQDKVFIRQHILRSNNLRILSHPSSRPGIFPGRVENGRIIVPPTAENHHLSLPGYLDSWCSSVDGLLTVRDRNNVRTLHVINPVTKQFFTLPRLPVTSLKTVHSSRITIAPVTSGAEYMAVCRYKFYYPTAATRVFVTSIGKTSDSWREIRDNAHHHQEIDRFLGGGIPAEGYVHWVGPGWTCDSPSVITSLDLKTEKFHESLAPFEHKIEGDKVCYLTMKHKLCCMNRKGGLNWEVLVLENPERGDWRKVFDIDLNGRVGSDLCHVDPLVPVSWVRNGEVVLMKGADTALSSCVVAYDVVSRSVSNLGSSVSWCLPHVDSLVSFPIASNTRG